MSKETALAFVSIAENVWNQYQLVGPGRVNDDLTTRFDQINAKLTKILPNLELPQPISEALKTVQKLASDCCHKPQGLCFISGEAGLVERCDL